MNEDQRTRSRKLADLLDRIHAAQLAGTLREVGFDMGACVVEKRECGTVACAMGWATSIFPELRLTRANLWDGTPSAQIEWGGLSGINDVSELFFGLPCDIFYKPYSAAEVAGAIRKHIHENAP